jgi:uncharacterized membrane protein YkoI
MLLIGVAPPALVGPSHAGGALAAEKGDVRPLAAVLKTIGQRFPGHALDAQMTERDGRPVYRIKWLGEDGRVREVLADARTGKILQVR